MIDVFTGLLLVALIGGGFLLARRLFRPRDTMNRPVEMPWQQEYGPGDGYGRGYDPEPGYDGYQYDRPAYRPGYGRRVYGGPGYGYPGRYYPAGGYAGPMYGSGYQPGGMSPWAAGGLGAVGGGLLGYELGRMAGENEQQAQEGDIGNPDQMATPDAGSHDPGIADFAGSYDVGGFSDFGGDFGGGDFGGIEL